MSAYIDMPDLGWVTDGFQPAHPDDLHTAGFLIESKRRELPVVGWLIQRVRYTDGELGEARIVAAVALGDGSVRPATTIPGFEALLHSGDYLPRLQQAGQS